MKRWRRTASAHKWQCLQLIRSILGIHWRRSTVKWIRVSMIPCQNLPKTFVNFALYTGQKRSHVRTCLFAFRISRFCSPFLLICSGNLPGEKKLSGIPFHHETRCFLKRCTVFNFHRGNRWAKEAWGTTGSPLNEFKTSGVSHVVLGILCLLEIMVSKVLW